MSAAAGTGAAAAPARRVALLDRAGQRRAPAFAQTGTAGRYVPYPDLPGMAYFAADTAAARAVVTGAALGLVADADAGTLKVTSAAAAAAAADALPGQPPADLGGFFSFWHALWDDIKKGVAQLKHVVVAVAREVEVAIHYVMQGAEHVFRAVVSSLEDLAATVARWFLSLLPEKDIIAIAQAMSIALQAFHIPDAERAIENRINAALDSYRSDMINHVQQPVDTFFLSGEKQIASFFTQIRDALGRQVLADPVLALLSAPSGAADASPIGSMAGAGTTEHTLFSVRLRAGRTRSPTPSSAPGRCTS